VCLLEVKSRQQEQRLQTPPPPHPLAVRAVSCLHPLISVSSNEVYNPKLFDIQIHLRILFIIIICEEEMGTAKYSVLKRK
jgi:hypothetical protein